MIAVIMAGGKGTRISSVASDVPKPMIAVNGMPVMEYQIERLRTQGIRDIVITVSHKKEMIMDYFGDGKKTSPATAKPFDVSISYYEEDVPLGNAGALFRLRNRLSSDFLLINADVVFDIDIERFVDFHKSTGGLVTLFTHPNNHPFDSGLLLADKDKALTAWLSKEDGRPKYYKNKVNAGLHIMAPKVLDVTSERLIKKYGRLPERIDLDRDLLKPLAGTGMAYCYDSCEYVRDMGTPIRYEQVCRDMASGRIDMRNLHKKQKAIFLDRDGTINKEVGFLSDIDRFELLPGVGEAIQKINQSGYLAIVITNQPVIARGELSREGLEEIHNKMETLLGKESAYLDGIYYCPHHPHGGYEGEVRKLKIDCDCRKPKPGMLYAAAEAFHIDLKNSWMIGDGERDIAAGKSAGCKTVLIGKENWGQDMSVNSLPEAVRMILEGESEECVIRGNT